MLLDVLGIILCVLVESLPRTIQFRSPAPSEHTPLEAGYTQSREKHEGRGGSFTKQTEEK